MCFHFKRLLTLTLILICTTSIADELQGINLEITTYLGDAQTFVQGDEISFMLSLDKPAYLYLFYQDAANHLIQVLPNHQQPDNHYPAGLFMPLPDANAGFRFIVQPPYGEEKLWAFASDQNVQFSPGKELPNGIILMTLDINQIRQQVRNQSKMLFAQDIVTLKTLPQQ